LANEGEKAAMPFISDCPKVKNELGVPGALLRIYVGTRQTDQQLGSASSPWSMAAIRPVLLYKKQTASQ
jgi:hypothetical protein